MVRRAYALRRPVENAYLVRQRDRRLLRELMGVLVTVLFLGVGLLAYTWVHIEMLRTGYKVDELEKELQETLEEERRWRLELALHQRPERIEERARRELGMQTPTLEQTLFFAELVP